MSWRQRCIENQFGGDAARFETVWQAAVKEGRRQSLRWQDIQNAATILPELETAGHDLITRRLGYLPHESVVLPYEPYLRGLLQSYQEGRLSPVAFIDQAEDHIQQIRNADMIDNLAPDYDADLYRVYETYLPHYAEAVRARFRRFLGYVPTLATSLVAQLWLRKVMAKDFYYFPDCLTAFDLKVLTLVKYREVLLAQGQAAADASGLLGVEPAISS